MSILTYTAQEDSMTFLCLDCFGTACEATCLAYKELTVNTKLQICYWRKGALAGFPRLLTTNLTGKKTWGWKRAEELLFPSSRDTPASAQNLFLIRKVSAASGGSSIWLQVPALWLVEMLSACLIALLLLLLLISSPGWRLPQYNAWPLFPLQSCTARWDKKLFPAFDICSCRLQTN